LVGSCDTGVKIAMSQKFNGSDFFLDTILVSKIDGATSGAPGCAGHMLKLHMTTTAARPGAYDSNAEIVCAHQLPSTLTAGIDTNEVSFSSSSNSCYISGNPFRISNLRVGDLGDKVGLEFS
jgi:hypothetical protein